MTAFLTQPFVCLIANTPLWQKRRGVRKVGCTSEHCKKQCSRSSRSSRGITDLGENLRGEGKAPLERLPLFPWVVSLVHSSNIITQNSEPEKCCPTNSTIGSLCYHSKNIKRYNRSTLNNRLFSANCAVHSFTIWRIISCKKVIFRNFSAL